MLRTAILLLLLWSPGIAAGATPAVQATEDFDGVIRRGVAALNAGDPATAASVFREALALRPDDPVAQTMLGTALLEMGDAAGAVDQLLPASRELPDHYPIRAGLGRAYTELGRPADAIEQFEAAVRLEPGDVASRGRLTTLLLRAGDPNAAIVHARELADQLPDNPGVQTLVGVIELQRGADNEALNAFDRALVLRPDDRDARYGKAAALRGLGRNEEAVPILDALVNEAPDRTDAWTLLGDIFAESEDMESKLAAVGMYRTALEARPEDPRLLGALFDLLAAAGLHDEALAVLEGAPGAAESPALAMRLGALQFEREEFDAARAAYEAALANGGGAEASYRLGVVLVNLAELEAAEAAFRRARAADPEHAAAQRELGKVLLDRGRADEAAAVLATAVAELPDDPATWYHAGIAASRTGAVEAAVERLRRAVELDPDNPDAHYNLGLALRQTGDVEGSRTAVTRSQELRREMDAAANREPTDAERAQAALRAGYLRYRVGSLAPALELLARATTLAPEVEGGWFYLGLTHAAMGNAEGAVVALERAAEMNPARAETWDILARTYERLGRTEDAADAAERAAALRQQ